MTKLNRFLKALLYSFVFIISIAAVTLAQAPSIKISTQDELKSDMAQGP